MLLKRYSDISYILQMPYADGIEQIKYAITTDKDEQIYNHWLLGGYNQKMSLSDFKAEISKTEIPSAERKEIEKTNALNIAKNVLSAFNFAGGGK